MKLDQVLRELEARSDRRLIAVWQRIGMDIRHFYGVSQTQIAHLAKTIGKDHDLAGELWASGVHDARLLAVLIEDKTKITEGQVFLWLNDSDYWDLSDIVVKDLLVNLDIKFVIRVIKDSLKSDKEFVERASYIAIGELARRSNKIGSKEFDIYLNKIDRQVKKARNWVVEAMLFALVMIGMRNKTLNKKAIVVAKKISEADVVVEYGDAPRQTPNVYEYLTSREAQAKLGS
ncbi:MAG: hypothetical protein COU10_02215 [Candidatus Harrisonbacteria bacterium CG10_big_fil_rev_8_21_14_0_10_45_28]|uniref:DNA alkylation repair protein n=1 Tax=Candidatus Harrisonbacteria bacterium CG10_big_fil_rev_8_21_14_0_10_45_28 TaxID=1974586 RepID=A0A2H0UN95_9BACT|nr:MAG: hypothetical protein COU10_02215 [Candidatus Harrisonbacteria bacterium CG10_big_fil_rev_8_21_14_0_10_45_28]